MSTDAKTPYTHVRLGPKATVGLPSGPSAITFQVSRNLSLAHSQR
jgi:hypothetical protein